MVMENIENTPVKDKKKKKKEKEKDLGDMQVQLIKSLIILLSH